jgi:cytochrome P450
MSGRAHEEAGAGLREHFDPYAPEFVERFYPTLETMRRDCPVVHSEAHGGFWAVTTYDDVARVLQDGDAFVKRSSASVRLRADGRPLLPMVIDPPDQAEFRRLLNPYFTPAAMAVHEPAIRRICTDLIDRFVKRGSCDFVAEFARPLPERVVFGVLLGLPPEDATALHGHIGAVLHGSDEEVEAAHASMSGYAGALLDRRRAGPARGDFIDALLHTEVGGARLDDAVVLRTVVLIMHAGLDTTTRAMANICRHLGERPELRRRLDGDPDAIPTAVEEFLRFESVGGGTARTTVREVELGGRCIPTGDRVMAVIASADRDESVFTDADELVLDRSPNRHLAFGIGEHRCLGAHLARLELRVGTEEVLRRLGDLRVAPASELSYTNSTSRGLSQLQITFTPSGPSRRATT